jgi:hypothetical protein
MVFLFLDFDGVLHRMGDARFEEVDGTLVVVGDNLFIHLARLEAVLRAHPTVQIVIMSTWRRLFSLPELRAWFSADIQQRIIGIAPLAGYSRQELAMRYMAENAAGDDTWIALDDEAKEFVDSAHHLVLCDPVRAFDAEAAGRLCAKLDELALPA